MLRAPVFVVGTILLLGACTTTTEGSASPEVAETDLAVNEPPATEPPDTEPPAAAVAAPPTTRAPTTTTAAPTTTTVPTTTTTSVPATTTTKPPRTTTTTTTAPRPPRATTTTTTIPEPELDVYDPACVVVIGRGDSLGLIAEEFDDDTVTVDSLVEENSIADPDVINAGAFLDVCVGNGLDDVTGEQRTSRPGAVGTDARARAVIAQQEKLNALFAGYGIPELLVDGISGPVTRQRLCAFRLASGLPVSRADMDKGSEEEKLLMRTEALPIPFTTALSTPRWVLVDMTCQILFAGEGAGHLQYVFNTSTGEAGHETRVQDRSQAFRYDPAASNGGWHNSSLYPVTIDNPLNGNMYKPIYFDGGQAIHGANNVPTSPQSKGCVRLRVGDQDALVGWLGLQGRTSPSWSTSEIGLWVNAQGDYVPD